MPGTPWATAAPPAGSTPTSSTSGSSAKPGEQPDGVGAAAHARGDDVGIAPEQLAALLPRLVADHPVQLAHHPGVRVGPHHRAEEVVARLDRGHPVAHRLVDGVLQRAAARRRRSHLGAEQAHAEHVERLALHVDLAHVDDALEAEERGGGGGGHAVLAGAGLGDDALLAHARGQQRLPQHVVDLVRAGVVEVLPLEQQRAAELGREPLGLVEERRAAGVVPEQAVELRPEGRVRPRLAERLVELGAGHHERLGDVPPAEVAEATGGAGVTHHRLGGHP